MWQWIKEFFSGLKIGRYAIYAGIGLVAILLLNSWCSTSRENKILRKVARAEVKYKAVIKEKDEAISKLTVGIKEKQKDVDNTLSEMRRMAQKPAKKIYVPKVVYREIDGKKYVSRPTYLAEKKRRETAENNLKLFKTDMLSKIGKVKNKLKEERTAWEEKEKKYEGKFKAAEALNSELEDGISILSQKKKGFFWFLDRVVIGVGGGYGTPISGEIELRPWVGVFVGFKIL